MSSRALSAERDLWLAGVAALVAAGALGAALRPHAGEDVTTTPTVAEIGRATGEVKLRLASTLGWQGARAGGEVHDGDAVFVPPGAEATIAFLDGTELSLDERSLVVIERPRAGVRSVTLRQGSLSGRAGGEGLTLSTAAGEARLEARAEARVELAGKQLEVQVRAGAARVRGASGDARTVGTGQRVAAAEAGTAELPAFPVRLSSPAPQAQLPFQGAPGPVSLRWEGEAPAGARVQVARDRLYAFVDAELPAVGGAARLEAPVRGVSWWRVVDAEGRPVSEARRFTCTEEVAPVAMFPRSGEVLLAPPGTQVSFVWAPVPGVSRYRLEISPSQGFEPVMVAQEGAGGSARLALSLKEATWFWRVRASDGPAGLGPPSEPMRFRVIHKGIPDAPELLAPEIEVSP